MDNASDYGSEDSRFDSWQDRLYATFFAINTINTEYAISIRTKKFFLSSRGMHMYKLRDILESIEI